MLLRRSVQMAQRTTEISDLPKANAVINVQYYLKKWKSELEQIITDEEQIRTQIRANDQIPSKRYGLDTPKGIIDKPLYDLLPPWLQIILITAAQYYYNCKGSARNLSSDLSVESELRMLPEIINDAKVGVSRITEMLSYIEKMVPEWYLNSPASIQDDKFMDR